ncbi:hypothetical protein [Synechocystis sp. PCC 7509]|nr:hypothetical protein [Synechocystis sp. PCC 7509]
MDSLQPPEPLTLCRYRSQMRRDTNLWRGQAFQVLPVLRPASP